MASYRELLQRAKAEIDELGAAQARERHPATGGNALFLDVREQDEWDEGVVTGAVHVPRGNLEQRIEGLVPDRSREIVVYCAGGSRSAFAAKTLAELGYENVYNLAGGFTDWKRNGFEIEDERRRARLRLRLRLPRGRGRQLLRGEDRRTGDDDGRERRERGDDEPRAETRRHAVTIALGCSLHSGK